MEREREKDKERSNMYQNLKKLKSDAGDNNSPMIMHERFP